MAHAGFPNGLGISGEKVSELIQDDNDLNRRLIIEYNKKPIGEMNYRAPSEKVAEIGIKICEADQQEKGYGPEFLKMLMRYLFQSMNYEKIIIDTNLKNKSAQLFYEKSGFQKVRIKIDSWKVRFGSLQSSVDYEITRCEYE